MAEYGQSGPGSRGNGASAGTMDANAAMSEQVEEYRQQAMQFAQRAQEWIQENPGTAVLGAAAIGFLFARFVARRRA